jgi:hypothetical protein
MDSSLLLRPGGGPNDEAIKLPHSASPSALSSIHSAEQAPPCRRPDDGWPFIGIELDREHFLTASTFNVRLFSGMPP